MAGYGRLYSIPLERLVDFYFYFIIYFILSLELQPIHFSNSNGSSVTTLIIPISACYNSELHGDITIQRECNISISKVVYVL